MIKFSLGCESGHTFESWFPGGEDYESQARRGLVVCPDCGSKQVRKAPMAPAVLAGRRRKRAEEPSATQPVALLDEKQLELRGALSALRREIEARTRSTRARNPSARSEVALRQPKRARCSRKA
jgi:hypothetical protein